MRDSGERRLLSDARTDGRTIAGSGLGSVVRTGADSSSLRTPEGRSCDLPGTVMFLSASGGVGVSVFAAMCAWQCARSGLSCALADLDLQAGGIDVTLGMEAEPGLRWGDINAPLGRMEPDALRHELPKWEGIPVLAADSWAASTPDWWEVQAALRALDEAHDVTVLDAGHSRQRRELRPALAVLVTELSVLGLARTKAELAMLSGGPVALVGVAPSWTSKTGTVDPDEAQDYLGRELMGVMPKDSSLGRSVLEGTGIPAIPRRSRKLVEAVCERIERECCSLTETGGRPAGSASPGGSSGSSGGSRFGVLRGRR
ncbi:AAA family ATPase [Bifidobacterium simiarum]|uniref:Uncharacterized protein n=1 Tax=Bifidobacterium simiarum TaxID=2045441 RepID=A0A2M9HGA0_9BIFI|nr:hypothetical protein [Bifidobacterium simiarum]PJM75813.1 hypothetical protein CSQ87_02795 [Bifidobacterium simiarum]